MLPPEDHLALLIDKAEEGGVYVLHGERMLWIDQARAEALGLTAPSLAGVAVDVTERVREEVRRRRPQNLSDDIATADRSAVSTDRT